MVVAEAAAVVLTKVGVLVVAQCLLNILYCVLCAVVHTHLQKHGDKGHTSNSNKHQRKHGGSLLDDVVRLDKHLRGERGELECRSDCEWGSKCARAGAVKSLTVMILEKMTANTGWMAPLMAAQMIPRRMYGHSSLFRRNTVKNDTGGASSCSWRDGTQLVGLSHGGKVTV